MLGESLAEFRERLDGFVFFHLGSDADVVVEDLPSGLRVAIAHARVRPFEFILDPDQLAALIRDPDAFEEFMLSQLTQYRRGGWEREGAGGRKNG